LADFNNWQVDTKYAMQKEEQMINLFVGNTIKNRETKAVNTYTRLIKMKINNSVFNTSTFEYSLTGSVKTIKLTSAGTNVIVVGNFDVNPTNTSISFPSADPGMTI
jgi:hypothetical protein